MDRRESLQWMLSAAALPSMWGDVVAKPAKSTNAKGYGTDPDLIKSHKIAIVFNTPLGRESFYDDSAIRKAATLYGVLCEALADDVESA